MGHSLGPGGITHPQIEKNEEESLPSGTSLAHRWLDHLSYNICREISGAHRVKNVVRKGFFAM